MAEVKQATVRAANVCGSSSTTSSSSALLSAVPFIFSQLCKGTQNDHIIEDTGDVELVDIRVPENQQVFGILRRSQSQIREDDQHIQGGTKLRIAASGRTQRFCSCSARISLCSLR
jgi:hypothetical protein